MIDGYQFFGQHLDHIGHTLNQTIRSYPIRTQATLEKGANLPFHINQYQSDHGIPHQQTQPDENKLCQDSPSLRQKRPQHLIHPMRNH